MSVGDLMQCPTDGKKYRIARCNVRFTERLGRHHSAPTDLHPCALDEHCDARDEVCSIDRRNNDHHYCCDCGEWMPT